MKWVALSVAIALGLGIGIYSAVFYEPSVDHAVNAKWKMNLNEVKIRGKWTDDTLTLDNECEWHRPLFAEGGAVAVPVGYRVTCIGQGEWTLDRRVNVKPEPAGTPQSAYERRLGAAGFAPKEHAGDIWINAECTKVRSRFSDELRPPQGVTVVCEQGFDGEIWRLEAK